MAYIVDQLYPPIKHIEEEDNEYTSFNYWREPVPEIDFNACDISGSSLSSSGAAAASATTTTTYPAPNGGKITPTATLIQQALPTIPENWTITTTSGDGEEREKHRHNQIPQYGEWNDKTKELQEKTITTTHLSTTPTEVIDTVIDKDREEKREQAKLRKKPMIGTIILIIIIVIDNYNNIHTQVYPVSFWTSALWSGHGLFCSRCFHFAFGWIA